MSARAGVFAVCAALATHGAGAQPLPFNSADRNPLVAIHGLPDSVVLFRPQAHDFGIDVDFDASNTLHEESRGSETLFIDGESRYLTIRLSAAPTPDWRVQLHLPWVAHDGGDLDGFIDRFHDAFGFPDGGRSGQPRDRLRFAYSRNGRSLLEFDRPQSGFGDLRLALGRRAWAAPDSGGSAWLQLKSASGSARRLTGSGAAAIAAWFSAWRRYALWAGYASGGALFAGQGEVLAGRQRDWTWFARAGGEYPLSSALALQLELSAHGPLYESDTRLLGNSAQVLIGGWLGISGRSRLHLAVAEDIAVGSAPDVVFHIAWRSLF